MISQCMLCIVETSSGLNGVKATASFYGVETRASSVLGA